MISFKRSSMTVVSQELTIAFIAEDLDSDSNLFSFNEHKPAIEYSVL